MRIFVIICIIVSGIILDLVSKYFFEHIFWGNITAGDCLGSNLCAFPYFPLIGEYFGLHLSYNSGVAFSFPVPPVLLQILTITLITIIIFYFSKTEFPKQSKLLDFGYACILAGALSHAYERIVYGYVVDFFSLKYFAIFNFADILITVGAISILFYYFYYERNHTTK